MVLGMVAIAGSERKKLGYIVKIEFSGEWKEKKMM